MASKPPRQGRRLLACFRVTLGLIAALLAALAFEQFTPPPTLACGLAMLGAVEQDSVIVWAHGCDKEQQRFEVKCFAALPQSSRMASADLFFAIDSGWVGSAVVEGLLSSTEYRCVVNVADVITTLTIKTFPSLVEDLGSEVLDIVHGSCSSISIWPWNSLASSFNLIAEINPRIIFLLGDNAYTDLTEYIPWYRKPFDSAHRNVLRQPPVQRVLQRIPSFVMFDDHEVQNDFEGGLNHPLAMLGLSKYVAYWGQRNPGRPRQPSALYYSFDYGNLLSVFVLDSRTHSDWAHQQMIGPEQFAALKRFLVRAKSLEFKFIILASPLSWSEDGSGSYFVEERRRMLDLIVEELNLCNVIIVSGDTHFGLAHRYRNGKVLEVGASPFQGWPFWPVQGLVSAEPGYEKIFVHGGAFFFGRLQLKAGARRDYDGEFFLYSWNMWWPQMGHPEVIERLPFNVSLECSG